MINYEYTTGAIGIGVAFVVFFLIRRNVLHPKYAIWWMGGGLTILILGVFPKLSDLIAGYVGVAYAPALVFTIALAMICVKMMLMDIERSRLEGRLRRLMQRNAILYGRIRKLERHQREEQADKVNSGQ